MDSRAGEAEWNRRELGLLESTVAREWSRCAGFDYLALEVVALVVQSLGTSLAIAAANWFVSKFTISQSNSGRCGN